MEPQASKYANRCVGTDTDPFEVVRVVSDKIMDVRRMDTVLDPSWKPEMHVGGFAAHCSNQNSQRWIITSNEGGQVVRLHKRKDGYWYGEGLRFHLASAPRKFHDYNF